MASEQAWHACMHTAGEEGRWDGYVFVVIHWECIYVSDQSERDHEPRYQKRWVLLVFSTQRTSPLGKHRYGGDRRQEAGGWRKGGEGWRDIKTMAGSKGRIGFNYFFSMGTFLKSLSQTANFAVVEIVRLDVGLKRGLT